MNLSTPAHNTQRQEKTQSQDAKVHTQSETIQPTLKIIRMSGHPGLSILAGSAAAYRATLASVCVV